MVPKWSAALNGEPNNNRIYCCSGINSSHTFILENDRVFSFIKDSILGVYVYNPNDTSFIRGYN